MAKTVIAPYGCGGSFAANVCKAANRIDRNSSCIPEHRCSNKNVGSQPKPIAISTPTTYRNIRCHEKSAKFQIAAYCAVIVAYIHRTRILALLEIQPSEQGGHLIHDLVNKQLTLTTCSGIAETLSPYGLRSSVDRVLERLEEKFKVPT